MSADSLPSSTPPAGSLAPPRAPARARPRRVRPAPERGNHLIVMLIAAVTVLGTVVAALQVDAGGRAAQFGRSAQALAILALERNVDGLLEYGYSLSVYRTWQELDTLFGLESRRQRESLSAVEAGAARESAERLLVASGVLTAQTRLLQEPYFRPGGGLPDLYQYWSDTVAAPPILAGEERAAAIEVSQAWGRKATVYLTIITLIAVTLFLYGLALILDGCLKWSFVGLGSLNVGAAALWGLVTLLQPVPHIPAGALEAYTAGFVDLQYAFALEFWSLYDQVPPRADRAIASLDRAIALHPGYASAYAIRGDAALVKGESLLLGRGDAAASTAALRAAIADFERAIAREPDEFHTHWNLGWSLYLLGDYRRSIAAFTHVLELAPQQQLGARLNIAANLIGLGQVAEGLAECRQAIAQAAAHPLRSDPYYFRQMIRNLRRLKATRPQAGLEEMERLLKEAFVSLEYRDTPVAGTTQSRLSNLRFAVPARTLNRKVVEYVEGTAFPPDTERVIVRFDYAGMRDGEQVVLRVYHNGQENALLNQVVRWAGGPSGTSDRLSVKAAVEHTLLGLPVGVYEVELYVEGNLRAEGAFQIAPPQ